VTEELRAVIPNQRALTTAASRRTRTDSHVAPWRAHVEASPERMRGLDRLERDLHALLERSLLGP
jgi:hypothetical protein